MIVKVQRPLISSDPETDILVYDEFRRHQVLLSMDQLPAWLLAELSVEPKVFAFARWKHVGGWQFKGMAEWQTW
jgi:hypothetical protein